MLPVRCDAEGARALREILIEGGERIAVGDRHRQKGGINDIASRSRIVIACGWSLYTLLKTKIDSKMTNCGRTTMRSPVAARRTKLKRSEHSY